MNATNPTGLGDPVLSGKRSLFQPPPAEGKSESPPPNRNIRRVTRVKQPPVQRIRTTTELTPQALTVIQEVQQRYRLKTGKVLPVWKVISQAVEKHGKAIVETGAAHF
jgi:hypothetical protein